MVKTRIKFLNGATAVLEGSPEEVAELAQILGDFKFDTAQIKRLPKTVAKKRSFGGPKGRIRALKPGGFFKEKRNISDVQSKLEEQGYIYPLNVLSPALIRLVRGHELRRIKEGGVYKYVNP